MLLWRASRRLSVLATVFVVAEGGLPVLVVIAMGRVTGAIPDTVVFGVSSPSGHRLLAALAEAGGIYALSLMRGPLQDALSAAATARVDALMQRRLVDAVCAPVGIEHLEDEEVLERLASARWELLGGEPAGAPMALISSVGDQLTGVLACMVLATFRWWLGLGLFVVWRLVRRPLGARLRAQAMRTRTAGAPLRRSWYLLGLAWKPPAAKEMRVYGLGDWVASRHRDEWLEGTEPAWRELRRLTRTAWVAAVAVLAVYGLAAGSLGWAADHHEISLRTLATMLPMLATSMAVGSVNYGDISLEKLLRAMPDLDGLTASLGALAQNQSRGRPAQARPAHGVRLHQLGFRYPGATQPVLRGVNLELSLGQSLGLVGLNGAGKTTLITLLARMREPTAGHITVDGDPCVNSTDASGSARSPLSTRTPPACR
jgi:ATP-binding cassette, subfamily B, bacterial